MRRAITNFKLKMFGAPASADEEAELVAAMAGREKLSLRINLAGLALILTSTLMLSYAHWMLVPIVLRLLAMTFTRRNGARLRRQIYNGEDTKKTLSALRYGLVFAGFTWGALLVPVQVFPFEQPAMALLFVVSGGLIMVVLTMAAVPSAVLGFFGGFVLAAALGVVLDPTPDLLGVLIMVLTLTAGIALALSTTTQQREAIRARLTRALSEANSNLSAALAQAEQHSRTDPLTGLLNRRAFAERIDERGGERGILLLIDLDHFKQINDIHGHLVGDRVLQKVAQALLEVVQAASANASAARFGGEEFVLLLPFDTNPLHVAERVRQRIAAIEFNAGGTSIPVRASIGVAEFSRSTNFDTMLLSADKAMYRAKQDGRNRTRLAA